MVMKLTPENLETMIYSICGEILENNKNVRLRLDDLSEDDFVKLSKYIHSSIPNVKFTGVHHFLVTGNFYYKYDKIFDQQKLTILFIVPYDILQKMEITMYFKPNDKPTILVTNNSKLNLESSYENVYTKIRGYRE